MDKDDTPAPSRRSPQRTSVSNWKAALTRFAIAGAFFVGAIGALAGILSHLNPALLSHSLATFLKWPIPEQALAVVGLSTLTGVVAAGNQIYQAIKDREAQNIVERGVIAVIERTIARPLAIINRRLKRIAESIENLNRSPIPIEPASASNLPADSSGKDASQPHEAVHPILSGIFISRTKELDWLVERLESHSHERDITVIYGIPGIGKSVLIEKAIERIKHGRFKGAIAHINCGEMNDHVEVVRSTLEYVDPNRRYPPSPDLAILRQISEQLLTDKERLIILDGVKPGVHLDGVVHALRTNQRSAHILISTTRPPSVEITPVENQLHVVALGKKRMPDGSEEDEALEMFARYAGLRSAKEFGERMVYAANIVEALDRHTLALQLMGGYVRFQLNILHGIAREVSELKEGMVRSGLEDVLKPVWVALETVVKDLTPEARTLLYGFVAAFSRVEVGRRATRALGDGLGLRNKDGAIHDLISHELMESDDNPRMPEGSDRRRLKIHPLLLGYIIQRLARPEWKALVAPACDAAASFYASYIKRYDHPDPARGAQSALEPDVDNITHALVWAINHERHENVVAIAHGMRRFWHDRWRNDMTERFMPDAVKSATTLAERAKQAKNASEETRQRENAANFSFTLGRMYRRTGRLDEAEPLFQRDLAFRQQQRQFAEQAEAFHQLAQLERSRGRMRVGLRYCRKGLAVVRRHLPHDERDDTPDAKKLFLVKGLLIAQQGRIQRSRGYLEKADKLFALAFTLFTNAEDLLEQGVTLGYRGRIARVRGQLEQALMYFEQSKKLALQVNDFRGMGVIATQFGRIARMHGDLETAKTAFEEGLNTARQEFDRQAEVVNLNYLGRIASSSGDRRGAERYFRESLRLAREFDDRLNIGVNLGHLGRLAHKQGDLAQARSYFSESLAILRKVEDRRGQALFLSHLALVDIDCHHLIRAKWRLWRGLRLIRQVGDLRSEGTLLMFQGQLDVAWKDMKAARKRFTEALERAQSLRDASGESEAWQWLDKIAASSGDITRAPAGD